MKIRAVAFDLDGTLVPGTTSEYLGEKMGHAAETRRLEDAYRAGTISNRDVAEWDGPFFAGRTRAEVYRMLAEAPIIGGLRETIAVLRKEGVHLLIATITWRFVCDYYVETYGLDAGSGCEMGESPPGTLTGKVARNFEAADKPEFAAAYCARFGIGMEEVAAIGDSRSDIPLFKAVGLPIAFNGTPEAIVHAKTSIVSKDIRRILPVIVPAISIGSPAG